MISWHLIQGCTFGLELVDGKVINPDDPDWYIVVDLMLVRLVINF
jgi:hypothetical protein